MKSDMDLLNLYKEEKAIVIGGIDERTGLEDFPSFKEWKLEYMKEYAETHNMDNPMSMEEAVAELEAELADEDEILPDEDLALLAGTPETPTEEDDIMTDETTPATEELPEVKTEVLVTTKTEKPKRASKPKVGKKVAATKRPPSKAKDAQKVFDRMYPRVLAGKKARKDVIDELVAKVGLTPNGAATYYQKMKKAAG